MLFTSIYANEEIAFMWQKLICFAKKTKTYRNFGMYIDCIQNK